MAILPTKILEIEFDVGVWTNVTADLVSIQSRRGRNRESGAFETGTLTFSLRNDARKYDPDNAAGTYYGKLRPNRRVRWRNTYNAVTYDCFVGYIDRIAQVGGGPNDATAEFSCSDFFKLLNRAELPRSVYTVEVATDAPALWYRLDEPVGSTVAQNSGSLGSAYNGSYNTTIYDTAPKAQLGASSLVVRDGGSAMTQPGGTGNGVVTPAAVPNLAAGQWAIEFWLNYATFDPGGETIIYVEGPAASRLVVSVVSQIIGFALKDTAGNTYGVISPALTAGVTYHVVLQHDAGRQMRIWLNGVESWSSDGVHPTVSAGTIDLSGQMSIGAALNGRYTMDEYAIYNSGISGARIAAHNSAGRTPWNGDTPGARLTRIFGLVATPASYTLDAGEPTLQNTSLGGTALAYAQKVEETTGGILFIARDGTVTFVGRNSAVTGAYLTSQATLVDDDSGAGIPYRTGNADADEARIVTRATISREGSVAVQYFDTAAKTEFGWLDETHDGLLHDSDAYSLAYAQWVVSTHKDPNSRVGAVTLELTANPATMYPAILALEIGQRVTWKRKAQNQGSVLSIDMRVEAISHTTGPGQYWTTTLQLSPFNLAGGLPVGVWDVTNWDQSVWGI